MMEMLVGWWYIQHSTNFQIFIKCALNICGLLWMNLDLFETLSVPPSVQNFCLYKINIIKWADFHQTLWVHLCSPEDELFLPFWTLHELYFSFNDTHCASFRIFTIFFCSSWHYHKQHTFLVIFPCVHVTNTGVFSFSWVLQSWDPTFSFLKVCMNAVL